MVGVSVVIVVAVGVFSCYCLISKTCPGLLVCSIRQSHCLHCRYRRYRPSPESCSGDDKIWLSASDSANVVCTTAISLG
ncbi:hypothetical protein M758_7G103500 [Ceratodon purpureus]|nr:hypothetical protein M758_7G103500 [Ceratodon purpureus]